MSRECRPRMWRRWRGVRGHADPRSNLGPGFKMVLPCGLRLEVVTNSPWVAGGIEWFVTDGALRTYAKGTTRTVRGARDAAVRASVRWSSREAEKARRRAVLVAKAVGL